MVHPLAPPAEPGYARKSASDQAVARRDVTAALRRLSRRGWRRRPAAPARTPPPPHGTRGRARPDLFKEFRLIIGAGSRLEKRLAGGDMLTVGAVGRYQYRVPRCQIPDHERQHVGGRPAAAAAPGGTEPCLMSRAEIGCHRDAGRENRRVGFVLKAAHRLSRAHGLAQTIRHGGDLLSVAEYEPAAPLTGRGVMPERIVVCSPAGETISSSSPRRRTRDLEAGLRPVRKYAPQVAPLSVRAHSTPRPG